MLRLFGLLVTIALALGIFVALDYNMARKLAGSEDQVGLTVQEYLDGLPDRIKSFTTASAPAGLPTRLADMLPQPPEGWTVRAATADDVDGFRATERGDGTREADRLVAEAATLRAPRGAELVALAYEQDDRRVLVQAIRYPDEVFTDPARADEAFALRTTVATFRPARVMTVRGLDITEDVLPDGMPTRLLMADVGGQIQLRLLAPKRMKDAELVTFLQTLHVEAMNASVVRKEDGLGTVPMIVVASALDDTARELYQADREARAAARRDLAFSDRAEAIAATATDPAAPSPAPTTSECVEGSNGIKRCTVTGN